MLNVVHGDKEAVDALLHAPRRARRSRSSARRPIAQYIYETATGHGKRVQALGGAKNHMLVLPDADLDLAADAAVNAGFGSAGERCMAISVVLAVDTIADELVEKIAERMARAEAPATARRGCDMGPAHHRASTATRSPAYIDVAASDGASVVVDGRDVEVDGEPDGFWLGPTLIDKVPTVVGGLPATRSSARCSRSCASTATRRASSSSTRAATATARRSSRTTAAPRGASSAR